MTPLNDGDCSVWHGFVPSATLGIAGAVDVNGLLLDPWLNPLRYSVAALDTGGSVYAFTNAAGLPALYANTALLVPGAPLLCVGDGANCGAPVLAATIPAVIFSMGADWTNTTSANEVENSDGTDHQFVSTTYAEDLFDDQLIWLSPYILFNRLIDAGKLP